MQYPPDKQKPSDDEPSRGIKRKNSTDESDTDGKNAKKSRKLTSSSYNLDISTKKIISYDELNEKSWKICLEATKEGYQKFVSSVEAEFLCVCCQEMLLEPVTTPCGHNACLDCLRRSFKAEVFACPACRHDLTQTYAMPVNTPLFVALKSIFPGYRGTTL